MKGADKHLGRLRALARDAERVAGAIVYEGADTIRAHAFQAISAGSISGKGHKPSAPGQAPNRDTGHLQTNLKVERTGPLTAEVRSEAAYAAALEFGTSKMAARPYMRPSRDAKAPEIEKRFREQMNKLVRNSG